MHVENYVKRMRAKKEGDNFWVTLTPGKLHSVLQHLRSIGLTRISSITGLDTGKKIEIIYHFVHKKKTLNIRTAVGRNDPSIDSITDIYPGANLFERELYEMLGVNIRNHPNLKKLFLSDEAPETPLRKF